jgi:hypothetical protein
LSDHATRHDRAARATRIGGRVAIAVGAIGVFLTWTSDGSVDLGGTEGPSNGWLVVILAAFALGWLRSMERGSWVGVIGVLGSSLVMAWLAVGDWVDSRAVVGARPSFGLLLVLAAAIALACSAVVRAVELARLR